MRCSFIKKGGERCRGTATGGATLCYSHDPARAEERSRNARKAGQVGGNGRPSGVSEIVDIKGVVRRVVGGVLNGSIERGVAAVAFQGFNTWLKAAELERRIREQDEIEERLAALEELQPDNTGGYRQWNR